MVAGHSNHDNLETLIKLDKICGSCLSNHVAKRASTRQVCVCVRECACMHACVKYSVL